MTKQEKLKERYYNHRNRTFFNFGFSKDKDYFIENIAMLLGAGTDTLLALEAIKQEARTAKMRKIIDGIQGDIDAGLAFWQALDKSGIVSPQAVALMRIGEEAGRLINNLQVIAGQQQKQRLFRSKIRSAMMYPILILSLTFIVGIGVAWYILPRLASVFVGLHLQLPLITRGLIAVGAFLGAYGAIAMPLFFMAAATAIYFIFVFRRTKFIGERLLFLIDPIKHLIQDVELSRFGFVLGSLLNAGLPISDALDSLYESTDSRLYKVFYSHLREQINDGNSFRKSFASYRHLNRLIPVPVQQMIVAAEQSGRLPEILLKIGEIYEDKTDITAKNLTVILEPLLLVVVWLGVVAVALAVILPIYSLIGGLNR